MNLHNLTTTSKNPVIIDFCFVGNLYIFLYDVNKSITQIREENHSFISSLDILEC